MANISADEFLGGGGFKVLSADEFLGGDGFTVENPTVQQQTSSSNTPANQSAIGKFVAEEFLGAGPVQDRGLLGSIVQSTVGSKGIAGVAQLPGRVAASEITAKTANSIADAAAQLQETNNRLAAAYSTVPQEKRAELLKTMRENTVLIDKLFKRANSEELQDYEITAGQALGTGLNAALNVATFGAESLAPTLVSKVAPSLAKTELVAKGGNLVKNVFGSKAGLANLAARGVEGAATAVGFQAASNLTNKEDITNNLGAAAAIGFSLPIAATALSKGRELFGQLTKATGQKIQSSVIKPSINDVRDGFKVENIRKYDLGGSLEQTLAKTNDQLNRLNQQLADTLASAGDKTTVNLRQIYQETAEALLKKKPGENFGDVRQIRNVLKALAAEIKEVGTLSPDLPTAQIIKRSAGTKGAWQFGNFAPDAKATELVYDVFYNRLKTAIEKAAPPGVREINQKMRELIPISNAVLRRIPIAERNNAISLTDAIGLFSTVSNPSVAPLVVANKLSKVGEVGNLLTKAGSGLMQKKSLTNVGRKLTGN